MKYSNPVERLHVTLKDMLKPLRDLKNEETARMWLDTYHQTKLTKFVSNEAET